MTLKLGLLVLLCWSLVQCQDRGNINIGRSKAQRPVGRPYQDWKLECHRRRSLGGVNTRQYFSDELGTDVMVRGFCRDITHSKDPILRISERDCYSTDPINLKNGSVTYEDKFSNCKEGDFISGIYSDYNNGSRELKLRCCRPFNAEIDKFVGCNEEGPINLFGDFHGFLKDPYDPREDCPRNALVGINYVNGELKFKYCAFRIDARRYLSTCPELKTGAVGKVKISEVSQSIESLYRLGEDKWSGVHQSWRFECKGFKVINHTAIGFAFSADEVRRDILFKMRCGPLIKEKTSAMKVRVTRWTKISWKEASIDDYGCRDHEALIGIASTFERKKEIRYVALICAEMCNADKTGCSDGDAPTVLKWGEVKEVIPPAEHSFHNIAMDLKGTRTVSLVSVFAKYAHKAEAKCNTSSRLDENSGVTIDPWLPELDILLKPSDLPRVKPGTWTEDGKSWRVECTSGEVVSKSLVKKLGDKDHGWNLECAKQVSQEQKARVVRYTKWVLATAMEAKSGCRDNEAVQGLMSFYHPESSVRYMSLICVEGSNANVAGKSDDVTKIIAAAETVFSSDGGRLETSIESKLVGKKMQVKTLFSKFDYVSEAKFDESLLVDEIEGVTSVLLDVNVEELDVLKPDTFTSNATSWKFECPGFEGIYNVFARNKILVDGSDDLEFMFNCHSALPEGKANVATKSRWTGWNDVHKMKVKLGCRNNELLLGIASYWHEAKLTRYFAFLCVEGSNAELAESARVLSFTVKEAYNNGTQMNGDQEPEGEEEVFQNLLASGFNYRNVLTDFNVYLTRFVFVEQSKFDKTTKTNEATGEVVETVDPPTGGTGSGGGPTVPGEPGFPPKPSLEEKEWSESGVDFSFRCEKGHHAVKKIGQRIVPWTAKEGQYDTIFRFSCTPVVSGDNWAYTYRVTKFKFIRDFNDKAGCLEDELLAGMNSFIDKKTDTRYVAMVCMKVSNGEKETSEGPIDFVLSRSKTEEEREGMHVQNYFFTFIEDTGALTSSLTFVRYIFKSERSFDLCEYTDDNSGQKYEIADCGGPPGATRKPGGAGKPTAAPGVKGTGFCALEKECPSGWIVNKECPKLYGCYKAFVSEGDQITWEAAADVCKFNHSAELAMFETNAKWEFIKPFLQPDATRYWFGLHRPTGGSLQWPDGSPVDYSRWMPYPTTGRGHTCGIVRNYQWLDAICISKWIEGYICQIV